MKSVCGIVVCVFIQYPIGMVGGGTGSLRATREISLKPARQSAIQRAAVLNVNFSNAKFSARLYVLVKITKHRADRWLTVVR